MLSESIGSVALFTVIVHVREIRTMKLKHQTISFIKSVIRIAGYVAICIVGWHLDAFEFAKYIEAAGLLLIASEVVGILEEIGHE